MEAGHKEIEKGVKSAKKARRKRWICFWVIIIIISKRAPSLLLHLPLTCVFQSPLFSRSPSAFSATKASSNQGDRLSKTLYRVSISLASLAGPHTRSTMIDLHPLNTAQPKLDHTIPSLGYLYQKTIACRYTYLTHLNVANGLSVQTVMQSPRSM